MNDKLPTIVFQLVWIVIPIVTLFISIRARHKHPDRGGNLMVAGSGIVLLTAVGNAGMQLAMRFSFYDADLYGYYYMVSGIVGIVGQALFLIGLYRFVESARSSAGKKEVLDHFFD